MGSFKTILDEIKRDCAWEQLPYDKISALAEVCGSVEVEHLIQELDALDAAALTDDAGDIGDEYLRLRLAYSQTLAAVGEPAIEPLLKALGSRNPKTRGYAARALGLIGNPCAFGSIVTLLSNESDNLIRMHLIETLGNLRDEEQPRFCSLF